MDDRIIICKKDGRMVTAVFRGNTCFKLNVNETDEAVRVGNIYSGRIDSMVPNMNACFVDIGTEERVYVPMEKLSDPVASPSHADGKLHVGDCVLIQIDRAAAKQKKASGTGELSIVGNAVVLTRGRKGLSFSKKIEQPGFRDTVRELFMGEQSEDGIGVMFRTNSVHLSGESILTEYRQLLAEYRDVLKRAEHALPGTCLREDLPEYLRVFRDEHLSDLSEVVTDDESVYKVLNGYSEKFLPEMKSKIRLYRDENVSLYHVYDLEKVFADALARTVSLKSGANIVFDRTEAMTVVDVNSGQGSASKKKDALKEINLEAAKEIARQLELRSLSGMILCDFISTEGPEDGKKLLAAMKEYTAADRSVDVVDMTALGIMELTRKKQGAPLYETVKKLGFTP